MSKIPPTLRPRLKPYEIYAIQSNLMDICTVCRMKATSHCSNICKLCRDGGSHKNVKTMKLVKEVMR